MQVLTYLTLFCFYYSLNTNKVDSASNQMDQIFETDNYYIDTITIAYEVNKQLTKEYEYGNALDPFPSGFIIFDGKIDILDYEKRFFVLSPFSTLMLNQAQKDSLETISLEDYLQLDSLLSNNRKATTYKLVNKNIKLDCGNLKYEYKIYEVIVKSIYLKQDSISKPIFSESLDKIETKNVKTHIFLPVEFISVDTQN